MSPWPRWGQCQGIQTAAIPPKPSAFADCEASSINIAYRVPVLFTTLLRATLSADERNGEDPLNHSKGKRIGICNHGRTRIPAQSRQEVLTKQMPPDDYRIPRPGGQLRAGLPSRLPDAETGEPTSCPAANAWMMAFRRPGQPQRATRATEPICRQILVGGQQDEFLDLRLRDQHPIERIAVEPPKRAEEYLTKWMPLGHAIPAGAV